MAKHRPTVAPAEHDADALLRCAFCVEAPEGAWLCYYHSALKMGMDPGPLKHETALADGRAARRRVSDANARRP